MTNITKLPPRKQPTAVVRIKDTILVTGYIASAQYISPDIIITFTSGKQIKILVASADEADTLLNQLYAAILEEETAKFPIPIFNGE